VWGTRGQPLPVERCTPEEYLALERCADERHEFYHGEVFAVSGRTPDHSLIISNVNGELGNRQKGKPCRVYESNLRVRIPRTAHYAYPDASVICGEREFDPLDSRKETVTNPALIVEVLSPSTEAWDRGGKFQSYRQIASLREYVLVSSDKPLVETFLRQENGSWSLYSFAGLTGRAKLALLGIELDLAEVYSGVQFPANLTDATAG